MSRSNPNRTVYVTFAEFFELYPSEPEQDRAIMAANSLVFAGDAQEHHRWVKKTAEGWRLNFGLTRAYPTR